MKIYIDANVADPNASQEGRLEQEETMAIQITHVSRQLARATEFLFHQLSGDYLSICMPKHVKQFKNHYVDTRVAEATLCDFAKSVNMKTLQNARDLVKHLVLSYGNTPTFKAAMRDPIEDKRIMF